MRAFEGAVCMVCGEAASVRNFGGDNFCDSHARSWRVFQAEKGASYSTLDETFRVWLKEVTCK